MTRKLIVMLALSFALSACESATLENNSNGNTAKPSATTQTPALSTPPQEASPAAVRSELKAGDKVKVTVNGASVQATVVSVDEKAGKVTVRVEGEKQDRTVALLIATAWLVTKESRLAKRFIPQRTPAAPNPRTPREAAHPPNLTETPIHREDPSPAQTHEPEGPPVVASFVLTPNRREAATIPVVNLRENKPAIARLQLALPTSAFGKYQAELRTDDGQTVFVADSLTADGSAATIVFDVPAGVLKTGNYQIELTRVVDGSKESVAHYYFLVQIAD